ncbi:MAG: hypothetical protein N2510_10190, partial [Ignavibacteria bacterium]|nr:hypothetical protein [Ignavibacteria bacterium]
MQLQRELERRSNVLIVGPPLSGKSRAIFNAFRNYRKSFSILVPRAVSFQKFSIPADFCFWRKKLIFIDDLQYYIEKQDNYHLMFKTAGLKNIPIIATCHSGIEFTKAKNRMIEYNIDIETVFRDVIETGKISEDEAKTFAKSLGIDWGKIIFNGTIGSLFMKLREMEKRYELMINEEKTILETLKILFAGGVYSDNGIFKIEHIKKAASFFELEGKEYEWRKWLEELENKEFMNVLPGKLIKCEEVYLEHVVKSPYIDGSLDSASLLGKIFSEDIDVLVQLGVKIYVSALASASMPQYLYASADVFNRVLSKGGEMEKRKASFYLGMIYWHLSRVEDTSVNAIRAIDFFELCLKFINRDTEPVEHARVSCKKANAYTSLSDAEDSEKNSLKAIEIYLQGLEVFLKFREYSEYAKTLSNLGAAYITLSRFSDPSGNYKKALQYFTEALKYKNETITEEYAGTLNNLAITYAKLAELEYPMLNLQKSIDTFEKILDLGLKNKYPERYATALNNLGIVYSSLANIKD